MGIKIDKNWCVVCHALVLSVFLTLLTANIHFFLKGVVTLREVATTFEQGAYHPTMLVILQALLALIGEVINYKFYFHTSITTE